LVEDTVSQTVYKEVTRSGVLDLPWVIDSTKARAVAQLMLQESRNPPRTIPMSSGIHWVMYTLGNLIAITNREGPVQGGYTGKAVPILGMTLNVSELQVDVMAYEARVRGTDGSGNEVG
jgi:hypothetical protein